jgi:hypothetical protein
MTNEENYVILHDDEFQKLLKRVEFLDFVQSASRDRLNLIRLEVEKEFKDKLSRIEKRQVEYQRFVFDLTGDLRQLELETLRRIDVQNQKITTMKREFLQLLKYAREEYINIFSENQFIFNNLIQEEKEERQKAVNVLENKISIIFNENNQKKEKVKNFLGELYKIFEEVQKIPEQFLPKDKMLKIERDIKDALYDFSNGFTDSSLIVARNAYRELVELRELSSNVEQEFIVISCTASRNLALLIEKIEGSNNITFKIENMPYNFDLTKWSGNSIDILKEKVNNLKILLDKASNKEDIKFILNKILIYEKDFEVIYEGVKELIVYSQIRYNLATKISSLLKKYLFSIIKSGYENEDFKEAYFVNMINRFGLELRLFVIPSDKDKKINRLKIQYIKRKNNNIKELSESLLKDLKSEGFDVTII